MILSVSFLRARLSKYRAMHINSLLPIDYPLEVFSRRRKSGCWSWSSWSSAFIESLSVELGVYLEEAKQLSCVLKIICHHLTQEKIQSHHTRSKYSVLMSLSLLCIWAKTNLFY